MGHKMDTHPLIRGMDDVPYWVQKLIRNANCGGDGGDGGGGGGDGGDPGEGGVGGESAPGEGGVGGDPGQGDPSANAGSPDSQADQAALSLGFSGAAAMDAALGPGASAAAAGMGIGSTGAGVSLSSGNMGAPGLVGGVGGDPSAFSGTPMTGPGFGGEGNVSAPAISFGNPGLGMDTGLANPGNSITGAPGATDASLSNAASDLASTLGAGFPGQSLSGPNSIGNAVLGGEMTGGQPTGQPTGLTGTAGLTGTGIASNDTVDLGPSSVPTTPGNQAPGFGDITTLANPPGDNTPVSAPPATTTFNGNPSGNGELGGTTGTAGLTGTGSSSNDSVTLGGGNPDTGPMPGGLGIGSPGGPPSISGGGTPDQNVGDFFGGFGGNGGQTGSLGNGVTGPSDQGPGAGGTRFPQFASLEGGPWDANGVMAANPGPGMLGINPVQAMGGGFLSPGVSGPALSGGVAR